MGLYSRRQSKPELGVAVDPSHPLAAGMVLALPMNEGSGLALYDASGNSNKGQAGSASSWAGTRSGPALKSAGGSTTSAILLANNPSLQFGTGPFTYYTRVTMNVTPSSTPIVWSGATGTNPQWRIRLTNATTLDFTIRTTVTTSLAPTVASMVAGSSHSFAVTRDAANNWTGFFDGLQVAQAASTAGTVSGPSATVLGGATPGVATSALNGMIECAFAWDVALPAVQLAAFDADPWQVFIPTAARLYRLAAAGNAGMLAYLRRRRAG